MFRHTRKVWALTIAVLISSVLRAQDGAGPGSQLPLSRGDLRPPIEGSISMEQSGDSLTVYRALSARAGVNVAFHKTFTPAPVSFKISNLGIVDALDELSRQTGNFWRVWDKRTIVIAPDTPAARRAVEPQILAVIPFQNLSSPQEMTQVITTLITQQSIGQFGMHASGRALVLVDSPDRIAAVERTVAQLDRSSGSPAQVQPVKPLKLSVGMFGAFAFPEAIQRERSILDIRSPSGVPGFSIRMNLDPRSTYRIIAELGGLSVVCHERVAGTARPYVVDGANLFTALDLASFQTGNVWLPLDSRTIIVVPDDRAVRASVEPLVLKTIYLNNVIRGGAAEVSTILRSVLQINPSSVAAANALVLRGTPGSVALAERLVAHLDQPGLAGATRATPWPDSRTRPSGTLVNAVDPDVLKAEQSKLKVNVSTRVSLAANGNAREHYEAIGKAAGVTVNFHPEFMAAMPGAIHAGNLEVFQALDSLSLATGNFWQVVDSSTILVAPDTRKARIEVEPRIKKTIQFSHARDRSAMTDIISALRLHLNVEQIEQTAEDVSNARITLTDTAARIALAEKLIADLDIPSRIAATP